VEAGSAQDQADLFRLLREPIEERGAGDQRRSLVEEVVESRGEEPREPQSAQEERIIT